MLGFDYAGYVATGWTFAVVLVGAYAFSVVRRGRRLSRRVPPGDRRWT
jgi:hypothetical protein